MSPRLPTVLTQQEPCPRCGCMDFKVTATRAMLDTPWYGPRDAVLYPGRVQRYALCKECDQRVIIKEGLTAAEVARRRRRGAQKGRSNRPKAPAAQK